MLSRARQGAIRLDPDLSPVESPGRNVFGRLYDHRTDLFVHSIVWLVFVWALFQVAIGNAALNGGGSLESVPKLLDHTVFHTWWLAPTLIPAMVVVAFALFVTPALALRLPRSRLIAGSLLVVGTTFVCAHLAAQQDASVALVFVIASVVMVLKHLSSRRSTGTVLWSMIPIIGAMRIARWAASDPDEENSISASRAATPMFAALAIIVMLTVAEHMGA